MRALLRRPIRKLSMLYPRIQRPFRVVQRRKTLRFSVKTVSAVVHSDLISCVDIPGRQSMLIPCGHLLNVQEHIDQTSAGRAHRTIPALVYCNRQT